VSDELTSGEQVKMLAKKSPKGSSILVHKSRIFPSDIEGTGCSQMFCVSSFLKGFDVHIFD